MANKYRMCTNSHCFHNMRENENAITFPGTKRKDNPSEQVSGRRRWRRNKREINWRANNERDKCHQGSDRWLSYRNETLGKQEEKYLKCKHCWRTLFNAYVHSMYRWNTVRVIRYDNVLGMCIFAQSACELIKSVFIVDYSTRLNWYSEAPINLHYIACSTFIVAFAKDIAKPRYRVYRGKDPR